MYRYVGYQRLVKILNVNFFAVRCASHYVVLGVKNSATKSEIKAAYYKKSKEWHPDKHPNNKEFHAKFLEIQNAYETLSNHKLRQEYDSGFRASGTPRSSYHTHAAGKSRYRAHDFDPYTTTGKAEQNQGPFHYKQTKSNDLKWQIVMVALSLLFAGFMSGAYVSYTFYKQNKTNKLPLHRRAHGSSMTYIIPMNYNPQLQKGLHRQSKPIEGKPELEQITVTDEAIEHIKTKQITPPPEQAVDLRTWK